MRVKSNKHNELREDMLVTKRITMSHNTSTQQIWHFVSTIIELELAN